MPSSVVSKISKALVVREPKAGLTGTSVQMCRMTPVSFCQRVIDPAAPRNNGRGKRGNCDSCYTRSCEAVRNGDIKEEELVAMGLWLPTKAGFENRLFTMLKAFRGERTN